jgi:DNA-binding LacI/PurR family transcriptional regulator
MLGIEPFYAEFISGMEEVLDERHGSVLLQVVPSLESELDSYSRWAASEQVSGVVLGDLIEDDVRPGFLHDLGVPTLVLGEPELPPGVSAIRVDNYGAMRAAVQRLASLGHKRIGRVSGPPTLYHTQQRTGAFATATAEAGVTAHTVEGDYTEESGEVATRRLLSMDQRPTAIIYDNDVMAVAALGVAYELHIAVPDELSLLAWDDSTLCRLAVPPLSAMGSDIHALGTLAARMLLRVIDGGEPTIQQAPPAQFITRGSTATGSPPVTPLHS